jgi:hypothetical protein
LLMPPSFLWLAAVGWEAQDGQQTDRFENPNSNNVYRIRGPLAATIFTTSDPHASVTCSLLMNSSKACDKSHLGIYFSPSIYLCYPNLHSRSRTLHGSPLATYMYLAILH